MSAELKKVSREYAERVCNGKFPITYSREQVVNHTANDFTEGWNRSIEENKPDWFKAGGMAERILIDWEMKQLKSKLNDVTKNMLDIQINYIEYSNGSSAWNIQINKKTSGELTEEGAESLIKIFKEQPEKIKYFGATVTVYKLIT